MLKKSILTITLLSCCVAGSILSARSVYADKANITTFNTATASDSEEEVFDFEWAKAHSKEQVISLDTNHVQGNIRIYAATVRKDTFNNTRSVLIYGKCDFPITSQDFGDSEEFEGKLYLPQDDNYLKYNTYIKTWLIWAPEDTNGKYDKQIFKCLGNADDGTIIVKGDSVELTLDGETFSINIDEEAAIIDTTPLVEAIVEHWNDYSAAKDAGLEIEETSENAYIDKNNQANALVNQAKEEGTSVTNDDIENMRKALNEAFADMTPKPYDKTELAAAIKEADEKNKQDTKAGKRYTKDSYDSFVKAYSKAKTLMELKNLNSIITSKEGDPITTHRDFRKASADLREKTSALVLEDYVQADISALEDLYYRAVDKILEKNHAYTADTRAEFYKQLDNARDLILRKQYAGSEDIEKAVKTLSEAMEALKEEELDNSKKFTLTIKYFHPSKDAVSDKIREYFKDDNGNDLEEKLELRAGEEYSMPIDEVRRFSGYKLNSFHYGADDGTLGLVKVVTDRNNKQYAVFKADASNLAAGTSLLIFYVEGEESKDEPKKDDNSNTPNQDNNGQSNIKEDDNKKPQDNGNTVVPDNNSNGNTSNNNTNNGTSNDNASNNNSNNNASNNGSSGGSSSGGTSSSGRSIPRSINSSNKKTITPDASLTNAQGDVPGEWIRDAKGWWFKLDSQVYTQAYAKNQWVQIKQKWYIFDSEGYILTSWQSVNNTWYFVNDSGDMAQNSWLDYNGKWYYVKADGSMAVNETTPDGYTVNALGEWVR